eukprot:COSAG02_NODE_47400_length_341_cov_0.900826_1_plen_44_part_01
MCTLGIPISIHRKRTVHDWLHRRACETRVLSKFMIGCTVVQSAC